MDNGHGGFKTAQDGKPYTTLLYADGPGFSVDTQGHRADITNVDTSKTGAFWVNKFIWSYLLTFDMFERFLIVLFLLLYDCGHILRKRRDKLCVL